MKRYEMIKPVAPFRVWDPQSRALLPEIGRRVLFDQYWSRRENEGAIEIIPTPTPPVTKNAAPPVTKKADPPKTKNAPPPVAKNGIAEKPGEKKEKKKSKKDKS